MARLQGAVVATASASGRRGGWRWPRWRTGCETRRSSRRRRPSTPPGAPKSAGWSRSGARGTGRLQGDGGCLAAPPFLGGPGPGADRSGQARCCWCWTTCNGATRRRWPSSRSAWGWPTAPGSWWPGHCARTTSAKIPSSRAGPSGCGLPGCSPRSLSARWRPPTRRDSPRRFPGSPSLRPTRRLLHATTGGFPLYVIEAARGTADPGGTPLPVGDLARCCANASSRRPRQPGRWPVWRRRWARTSPSTCSPRPATWTPTSW